MVFVDDFWIAILLRSEDELPGFILLNTKQATGDDEAFSQTTFYLDSSQPRDRYLNFVSNLGGHEPSHDDDLFAPFYPDTSQRVLVIEGSSDGLLVMKTEALLKLAQERKGEDLQWEEWQSCATWLLPTIPSSTLWLSGPRLCLEHAAEHHGERSMDVFDLSVQASARRTETEVGCFEPDATQTLPWETEPVISYGCHDNITFVLVRTTRSSNLT